MKLLSGVFYALLVLSASATAASAAFIQSSAPQACAEEHVVYETYIGKDQNTASFDKRQSSNVCGAACNTYCWAPAGGGPNTGDCAVIANALLYESQNVGALFNVTPTGTPTGKITMQYKSCLTYFLNQDFSTLVYCRTEWSKLVNWLATDCDADNNAHGGLCVATDQRWYVQVQHS
ncbi:hypothetical protein OH77DRAFT_643750 [Trametes cingulata]|nr:hypothetical protein OH77DRAFT_643750 [Trametes cingulata]